MKTTVVNKRNKTPYDIYIGRGTPFGNPYDHNKLGITRDESIRMYRVWFHKRLTDPWFHGRVMELKGKILGCWCVPLPCHGNVIIEYLENYENN